MLLEVEAEVEVVRKAESFGLLFLRFHHLFLLIRYRQIVMELVLVVLEVVKVVVVVSVEVEVKVQEAHSEFLFGIMDLMA
jgi:hypothetical protein